MSCPKNMRRSWFFFRKPGFHDYRDFTARKLIGGNTFSVSRQCVFCGRISILETVLNTEEMLARGYDPRKLQAMSIFDGLIECSELEVEIDMQAVAESVENEIFDKEMSP